MFCFSFKLLILTHQMIRKNHLQLCWLLDCYNCSSLPLRFKAEVDVSFVIFVHITDYFLDQDLLANSKLKCLLWERKTGPHYNVRQLDFLVIRELYFPIFTEYAYWLSNMFLSILLDFRNLAFVNRPNSRRRLEPRMATTEHNHNMNVISQR